MLIETDLPLPMRVRKCQTVDCRRYSVSRTAYTICRHVTRCMITLTLDPS
ncbi:MAG: hypothetical protein A07HR60_02032, partial [uncultured archaeon A07HR60]